MNEETDNLSRLPDETLISEILPYLNNEALNSVCQINRRMNILCQKEELWKRKIKSEYPLIINNKRGNATWREWYRIISRGPRVPIYLRGDVLAEVIIDNTLNVDDIKKLIPNKDLDIYYFVETGEDFDSNSIRHNSQYVNQSVPYYHSFSYYPFLHAKCLSPDYNLEIVGDQKYNDRVSFISLIDAGAVLDNNNILNIGDSRNEYPYYIYDSYLYDLSSPQNPLIYPADDIFLTIKEEIIRRRHIL